MRLFGLWALAVALAGEARAAPATHLVLSNDFCLISVCPAVHPPVPAVTRSGETFGIYVIALDDTGVPDFDYTGTIVFESSDPEATLPAPHTFVHAEEARAAFSAIMRTRGPQKITVRDDAGGLAPGVLTMEVTELPSNGIPASSPWSAAALAALLAATGIALFRFGR
jgi:hypothetical protein